MESFIYEATIHIAASCKQDSQRKPREAIYEERVPLRLGVLEAADAPLALRLSFQGFDTPIDVRTHAGQLWVPFGADDWIREHYDGYPGRGTDFVARHEPLEEVLNAALSPPGRYNWDRRPVITEQSRVEYRDVVINMGAREEILERLYSEASNLLGVKDGSGVTRLWVPIAAPCWMLRRYSSSRRVEEKAYAEIRLCLSNSRHVSDREICDVFAITDLVKANTLAAFFGSHYPDGVECETVGEVEIFRDDHVKIPIVPTIIGYVATRMVFEAIHKDDFPHLSVEEFKAWAEFRDIVRQNCPPADENFGRHRRDTPENILFKAQLSDAQARKLLEGVKAFAHHYVTITDNRHQRQYAHYGQNAPRLERDIWQALGMSRQRERLIIEGVLKPEEAYLDSEIPEALLEISQSVGAGMGKP